MLKCWVNISGYKQFVSDKWNAMQVEGWGGFVLKEKLKLIKSALKEWHNSHVRNLSGRMHVLKELILVLDGKREVRLLLDDEIDELHDLTSDLHSLAQVNSSICWQKSRLLWLKDRDQNYKHFHSILAGRRRGIAISSLMVDDVHVEGV